MTKESKTSDQIALAMRDKAFLSAALSTAQTPVYCSRFQLMKLGDFPIIVLGGALDREHVNVAGAFMVNDEFVQALVNAISATFGIVAEMEPLTGEGGRP